MKAGIRRTYGFVKRMSGLDPIGVARRVQNLPRFIRTLVQYSAAEEVGPFPLSPLCLHPILADFRADAGAASGHYFFQDLWAARRIFARRPGSHIDVGSRIDGFIAHLLTFMPVTVLDVRPLRSRVSGLTFVQEDATNLAGIADGTVESLSSLHAVEHFGLGRYGDPVAPDAWRRALIAMQRVLAPGGRLYLSVPVGRERLCFNAHRVFSPMRIVDALGSLRLISFSAVDDAGQLLEGVTPLDAAHLDYGCGLFELTK
jgi:SAM-dependent methyltransferase